MKKLIIICICFFSYIFSTKAAELKLIKEATVETDYVLDGIHGILISYNYEKQKNYADNDSINQLLFNRIFSITLHLFENGKAIKPIADFENLAAIDGSIQFIREIRRFYPYDLPEPTFIPYATLNLNEGKHTLTAKFEINSTDWSNKKYKKNHQKFETQNISFVKPKTQKLSVHFDKIELVKEIDVDKTATKDEEYSDEDYTNATVNINLSGIPIYTHPFKDKFNTVSKEDCINFTISKNDIININIKYEDDFFNDNPTEIYINTEELIANKWTEYNKKNERLLKCKIFYKVE